MSVTLTKPLTFRASADLTASQVEAAYAPEFDADGEIEMYTQLMTLDHPSDPHAAIGTYHPDACYIFTIIGREVTAHEVLTSEHGLNASAFIAAIRRGDMPLPTA